MGKRVIQRTTDLGISVEDALKRVKSYPELIEFYKELGIEK
jgi:hypothetical protein